VAPFNFAQLESKFREDKSGNTIIIFALTICMLIGFVAVAVDAGSFYYAKRKLQGSTDLAALAAASDLANAQNAAIATLNQNGFGSANLLNVEPGVYTPDPTVAPTQRFVVQGGSNVNAVRLTTQMSSPMIFGRIFNIMPANAAGVGQSATNNVTISAKAVAAQTSFASFAIGSGLLNLNGGILNSMLGSLIGGNLSLSVMDYQNLANANIDLFSFSNALATRVHLTGVTYSQVASTNVQLGDVLNAIVDTANATPNMNSGAISALSQIAAARGVTAAMTIAPLVSFGPYAQTTVGSAPISATMSAYDLVSAVAQIANGTNQVQTALSLNIPGIAAASLQLAIGQPPVGTSLVGVGAVGTTIHTAQTRLLLNVQLVATGQTALVNVPIYIELAAGTATLTALSCSPGNVSNATVTLAVTPSVADAWIGNVSNANFTNLGTPLNPGPATLFNLLNLVTVTGSAHASISNISPTQEIFTYSDIQQQIGKTTSTTDYLTSLLTSTIGNLQVTVNVAGLGLGVPPGIGSLVTSTVATATTPIDQLLAAVLSGLGISIGNATTWVTGVTCGNSVLVN
jgi:uncharacterized membrane protein